MAGKTCKNCGALLQQRADTCPECGASQRKKVPGWVWGLLVVLILFMAFGGSNDNSAGSSVSPVESADAIYEGEIVFQDTPWGISPIQLSEGMSGEYFESMTPGWSDTGDVLPVSSYILGYRFLSMDDITVGGYDLANLNYYFKYGQVEGALSTAPEDAELYLVVMNMYVADVEGTYQDLLDKLSSIYGEPKVSHSSSSTVSTADGYYKSEISTAEWAGQNSTGIKLEMSIPEEGVSASADTFNRYVTLSYGKTDSDADLAELYKVYTDYLSGQEAAARDQDDLSGL